MSMFSLLSGWRGMLAVALAAAVLAAGMSFYVTNAVGARRLAEERAEFAQYRISVERQAREASELARTKEATWQARVNALQNTFDEEARDAETIEKELRASVLSGARKLRVAGVCPGGFGSTGANSCSTGSGDAAAIELAPAARRVVLDLREAVRRDQRTLRACQAYVREVSEMR